METRFVPEYMADTPCVLQLFPKGAVDHSNEGSLAAAAPMTSYSDSIYGGGPYPGCVYGGGHFQEGAGCTFCSDRQTKSFYQNALTCVYVLGFEGSARLMGWKARSLPGFLSKDPVASIWSECML